MADLLRAYDWTTALSVAACTVGALVVYQLWSRPVLSKDAPRILKGLPVLGSLGFFKERAVFLQDGRKAGAGDHFSFYYGPHPIIATAGDIGRAVFFGTRELDFTAGYQTLLVGAPSVSSITTNTPSTTSSARMSTLFKRFLAKNKLASSLPKLVKDVGSMLEGLDTSKPMDAFGPIYELIYQLTHRTLGCDDIADDPKLLAETLRLYTTLGSSSGLDVMFTWLPTPGRLYSKYCGAKLYFTFSRIMQKRRDTGTRGEDAMQIMMDAGDSDLDISIFIIGALFAGLLNSGVNASWIPVYLAENPEWYKKMQKEVDTAVEKHRQTPDETAADIFPRLTLEEWETEFPSIDGALQDSIRLNLPGACIRKNISGKDIEIPGTNKVIPNDTYAVYLIDDVHMNPEIYPDPLTWDPARYAPGREEDKKVPNAFLGWGAGFHPCLGMRFAKLEMALTTAMFVAYYDFELCEKDGSPRTTPVPRTDRNFTESTRKTDTVFLKLTPRF